MMSDAGVIALIAAMFGMMALGIPLFIAIGMTAFVGLCVLFGVHQGLLDFASFLWQSLNIFELVMIPLFVFAAMLLQEADFGPDLFEFAKACVGFVPNGLGVAVVLTCAIFAAITGSSPVTAVTVGLIALPVLAREGFTDSIRGALIAGGGTLGILMPPSLPLIIYGVLTQTSISSLFMGTVIPGLLLATFFSIYVMIGNRPRVRVPPYVKGERVRALLRGLPVAVLPVFIIGSIYTGIATPSETGALAVAYMLALGVVTRRLTVRKLLNASRKATLTSSMLLMIFGTGSVLARYSAMLELPQRIAESVSTLPGGDLVVYTGIILTDLLLGTFLESGALTILTIPIFFPIARHIGLNPVQFGVMIAVNQELAQIHPPAGLNLVTVSSISNISLTKMMGSILPFIGIELVMLYLLYFVPDLTLFLPHHMAPH